MSRVAPHNSFVKIESKNGKRVAVKYYQRKSKYSAQQESRAYKELQAITSNVVGVRSANVLEVEEKENTLTLEYISGLTLQENIKKGNIACLELNTETLISLFISARNREFCFDSDPSNMMFDDLGIVLIDPVCEELKIKDYSFIVFMWGLIKILLRNGKVWRIKKVIKIWNRYLKEYCRKTNTSIASIYKQMVKYIDLVIAWNKKKNDVENIFVYYFRIIIVIPIYIVIRQYFGRVIKNS